MGLTVNLLHGQMDPPPPEPLYVVGLRPHLMYMLERQEIEDHGLSDHNGVVMILSDALNWRPARPYGKAQSEDEPFMNVERYAEAPVLSVPCHLRVSDSCVRTALPRPTGRARTRGRCAAPSGSKRSPRSMWRTASAATAWCSGTTTAGASRECQTLLPARPRCALPSLLPARTLFRTSYRLAQSFADRRRRRVLTLTRMSI